MLPITTHLEHTSSHSSQSYCLRLLRHRAPTFLLAHLQLLLRPREPPAPEASHLSGESRYLSICSSACELEHSILDIWTGKYSGRAHIIRSFFRAGGCWPECPRSSGRLLCCLGHQTLKVSPAPNSFTLNFIKTLKPASLTTCFGSHFWVAVKELKLSYFFEETLLFTVCTHYG